MVVDIIVYTTFPIYIGLLEDNIVPTNAAFSPTQNEQMWCNNCPYQHFFQYHVRAYRTVRGLRKTWDKVITTTDLLLPTGFLGFPSILYVPYLERTENESLPGGTSVTGPGKNPQVRQGQENSVGYHIGKLYSIICPSVCYLFYSDIEG